MILLKYISGSGHKQSRGIKLEKDVTVILFTKNWFSIKLSDKNDYKLTPKKLKEPPLTPIGIDIF